jgi:DNA-binding beta-propeller fold protein YncE
MIRIAACLLVALAALPARGGNFTNFESGHVRPLALSPGGEWLFAVNTPDARLTVYALTPTGASLATEVVVGLEPVAVASRVNAAGRTEAWVVNHLSDSISVVEIDPVDVGRSRVARTLHVGDEPRDIVFAHGRAFVTAAHRGQNRPGDPQLTTEGIGRADVWVFDADGPNAPLSIIQLFGDTPRALAVSPDGATVYAAIFNSGNRTTTLLQRVVSANGGLPPPPTGATPGGPATGLIVQRVDDEWLDEIDRDWSASLAFSLPDLDVFRIDAAADPPVAVGSAVSGVGTVLFNLALRPTTGTLYVSNLEARNQVRFEPMLRGHLTDSRITVVDGDTATPVPLNPHVDIDVTPGPPDEIAESLAFPTDMVFSPDGTTLYVAAFGSGTVAAIDATLLEAGIVSRTMIPVGDGPSGLALDAPNDRLFVMNRIGHSVSVVAPLHDPQRRAETDRLALPFDPSPASTKNGRRFFYDATHTSGHGTDACASCHVFADVDGLAWDLGDPFGVVAPNPNPMVPGINPRTVHPMKGPMSTQSLRGLATAGAMHWRGDRTGAVDPGGSSFDEVAAFAKFNPAFVSLLGNDVTLTDAQLAQLTDFVMSIQYPPNPIRALDGTLTPAQQAGQDFFMTALSDGPRPCNSCHALPLGTNLLSANDGEPQDFKVPHLRNAYQKIGMFGLPPSPGNPGVVFGDQVRGFGYLHNGGVATMFQFLNAPRFTFGDDPNTNRRNVEEFILSLDTGLAPIVGQQATTPDAGRIALLLARADAGECDVVVKGIVDGEARGALYAGGGTFRTDRTGDATRTTAALLALATVPAQEQTFTAVPPGNGRRIAIDRDLDGALDRDELDAGSDPRDATSTPGGPTFTLIPSTKLDLRDRAGNAARRKIAFTSKMANAPGTIPDPTQHGATLVVYDSAGTGESVTFPLAAAGWSRSGSPTRPTYNFRSSGPITRVTLTSTRLTIRGGRADFGYSLDEPRQGRIALRLVLGDGAVLCADSPPSSPKTDRVDWFKGSAKTAPPPFCPQLPVF